MASKLTFLSLWILLNGIIIHICIVLNGCQIGDITFLRSFNILALFTHTGKPNHEKKLVFHFGDTIIFVK